MKLLSPTAVMIGVDPAKAGADHSVVQCPTCKTMQELTANEDYHCKFCAKQAHDNVMMRINLLRTARLKTKRK